MGMNLGDAPALDKPEQAFDIVNMDVLSDGTLCTRQPIELVTLAGTNPYEIIGYHVTNTGALHLIVTSSAGTYSLNGTTLTSISATVFIKALQYNDYTYLLADAGGSSGRWKPGSSFATVAGFPAGQNMLIAKDRLLVIGYDDSCTLTWSYAGDFTNWTAPYGGSVYVNPKDGQRLTTILNYQDQILIFKTKSTYLLSFNSDPSLGTLRLLDDRIGCPNRHSAKVRNDTVMLYFNGKAYSFASTGTDIISKSLGVDLTNISNIDSRSYPTAKYQSFVSFIDDTKVIFYVSGRYFVYHMESPGSSENLNAWTRYDLGSFPIGPLLEVPSSTTKNDLIAGSLESTSTQRGLYYIRPMDSAVTDVFTAYVQTKVISLQTPSSFKRLHWWGCDLKFKGDIDSELYVVVPNINITWDQLEGFTYNELDGVTWNKLGLLINANLIADATTTYDTTRTFVKFVKPMRFRQIQFKVVLNHIDSAGYIYTLNPVVSQKELVPAKIN